ncbi:unnamed protein product [Paramecium pentaurelia]|uniref:Uncharacterized protein n=1 Tax=Paramecium pentaurelia TaxID=43138 RepID=A0A8S1Y270_9CILI|nr:unnamed protein product [Paramecium pentaurelia]
MFIIAQITYCLPLYFLNFEKICTLSNKEFCLQFFSYFVNDQTKTSLNQKLVSYINPAISNSLRSYLTAEGQEICTASSIDDFNIAPEIINCQKHILKCKQYIQSPELIIKYISIEPMSYVIQCLDGYQIILNWYYQYCDDNCQVCQNMKIDYQKQFY